MGSKESRAKPLTAARVVATSLGVSLSDISLNLLVALLTGSTVLLSQALQGLSDILTGGILYLGVRRSGRKADLRYQFGYGREIFFWVLMGGIFMFMGTGGLSVYLGVQQVAHPDPLVNSSLALIMLSFGFLTNLYAFSLSLKRLHRADPNSSWWRQLVSSSIVETKATMLIDFMGTLAAVLGLVALGFYQFTANAQFDGLGSIFIGLGMMVASVLLIRDVRDLIVGRSVDETVAKQIQSVAESVDGVEAVLDLRTMYLGSAKLLVIIEAHVQDGLETDEIERIIDKVKDVVSAEVPQVHHIQVEIETPDNEIISTEARRRSRKRR